MTKQVVCGLAVALAAACGGGSGDNNNNGGNGNGTYMVPVNGTFSGAVTGSVKQGELWVFGATDPGSQAKGALSITAAYDATSSTGQLGITSPTGATAATFVSSIGFMSTPATGTFRDTDSTDCGGVALSVQSASTVGSYVAANGHDCNGGSETASGSYTLTLTSVSPYGTTLTAAGVASFYTVHGSLVASMAGQSVDTTTAASTDGTVSLNLTF